MEKDDFATPFTGTDFLFSLDKIWCLVAEFGNQKQMGCECAIATCIFMGFGMVKFMQLYRSGHLQDVATLTVLLPKGLVQKCGTFRFLELLIFLTFCTICNYYEHDTTSC